MSELQYWKLLANDPTVVFVEVVLVAGSEVETKAFTGPGSAKSGIHNPNPGCDRSQCPWIENKYTDIWDEDFLSRFGD